MILLLHLGENTAMPQALKNIKQKKEMPQAVKNQKQNKEIAGIAVSHGMFETHFSLISYNTIIG